MMKISSPALWGSGDGCVMCTVSEPHWNSLNATFMLVLKAVPKPWTLKAGQALEFWDAIVLQHTNTIQLACRHRGNFL